MSLLKKTEPGRTVHCKRCHWVQPKRKFKTRSMIYGGWICTPCVKEVRKNRDRGRV